MATKGSVAEAASKKTRATFAKELKDLTTFSDEEKKKFFPTPADEAELKTLLDVVNAATDDNDRRAKVIRNIDSIAGAVTKIVTKAVSL